MPTGRLVKLGKHLPERMEGKVVVVDAAPTVPLPVASGGGDMTYHCTGCYGILLENIDPDSIRGPTVFVCPKCGSYNGINV